MSNQKISGDDYQALTLGTPVSGEGGSTDVYSFTVSPNKKYVMELQGPTVVQAGIWSGTEPAVAGKGVLKVCGANSWGVHLFKPGQAGPCVVQVTAPGKGAMGGGDTEGPYTLLIRPYKIWDEMGLKFTKKSTC